MAEIFVEASLNGQDGSGIAYFILWDHYVAFNWNTNRVVDGVHPLQEWGFSPTFVPVSGPGIAPGPRIDGALKGRKGFAPYGYFFKDAKYARYNLNTPAIDPPGETDTSSGWGFPSTFGNAVDAAFNGQPPTRDGKAYFFRGSKYLRYTWAGSGSVDSGYPKEIDTMVGMHGLPYANGVDAAVDGDGPYAGVGYLFKEDEYLRFTFNPPGGGEPRVDGASAKIAGNWPGLVELLAAGKAKAQGLAWLFAAQLQLGSYAAFLAGAPYPFDRALMEGALSKHFHIAPAASAATKLPTVNSILASLTNMASTLAQSPTLFVFKTDAQAVADGAPGIAAYFWAVDGKISFTPQYITRGPMYRAAALLHESVHVFDNQSGTSNTHISEWYVTAPEAATLGLTFVPDMAAFATRYDQMTTADALHNPSSYAAFCQHIFYAADTRYGDGHPTL